MGSTMRLPGRLLPTAALLAALLATHGVAQAQASGTKTLGGGSATGGKLLTRAELRACMQQQDELAQLRGSLDARRAALDAERAALQAESAAFKADSDAAQQRNAQVMDYNQRQAALSERVKAYNLAMEELGDARSSPSVDRKRRELEKERLELQRLDAAGRAEGEKLMADREKDVAALGARGDALAQKAADWNARSKALDDEANTYEDKRLDWKIGCADRRYREDDEKAIKSGK